MARDLTPDVLETLRRDLRDASDRVDRLAERVDDLIHWVDDVRSELATRIDVVDRATGLAVTTLTCSVGDLAELWLTQSDLAPRVERCERRLATLEPRVPDG